MRCNSPRLAIAINAQIGAIERSGGVLQAVAGLVHALGQLDGGEDYLAITSAHNPRWIEQYVGSNTRVVVAPPDNLTAGDPAWMERIRHWSGPLRPMLKKLRYAARLVSGKARTAGKWSGTDTEGGFWQSLHAEVVYFPYQDMVLLPRVPCAFNPHDLQHLHHPQFFTPEKLAWRETYYRLWCRRADAIVVPSQWTKADLVKHYCMRPDRVCVIPWGSGTEISDGIGTSHFQATLSHLHLLVKPFAYFPARTWPHKNHTRLLEALALLRDRYGLRVPLVCTGHKDDFWPQIDRHISDLDLRDQVHFLGYVSSAQVRALYSACQFVVFPTLFEGYGFPLIEAFRQGVAIACSNVTCLPEQAGDAALLFDPQSVESIADAIRRMATDEGLRCRLAARGRERDQSYSWQRTAKTHRALFRRLGGWSLTEDDRELLARALGE